MQRVMNATVQNKEQEQKMFEMHQKHSKYFTIAEKWETVYLQAVPSFRNLHLGLSLARIHSS